MSDVNSPSHQDPFEGEAWDEFVTHVREDSIAKMVDSAIIMHLSPPRPDDVDLDIRYCVELGASLLLDKPIIVIVLPGREDAVPERLRRAADAVVRVDLDTETGREELQAALHDLGLGASDA